MLVTRHNHWFRHHSHITITIIILNVDRALAVVMITGVHELVVVVDVVRIH